MDKNTNIAIIGGGIGGLTTALCLEHFGFKNYTVYERAPGFREVGAALSLFPNALRVYRKIRLYEKLRPQWGELKETYVRTARGKVITRTTPAYELPIVCIHRAHLLQTLVEALPGEKLRTGHALMGIETRDDSPAILDFGKKGKTEAELVIGADGIHSVVRKEIINDGPPIYRGYNIWRGIATLDGVADGYASETWGRGARVGMVPIRDGKFGWWATLNEPEDQSDSPEGTLRKLQHAFGEWHDPIPRLFGSSPEILKNGLYDRVPRKGWARGNVVLLGDAAHPTTPNLGQGACMAIEGSYLLSACLDTFQQGRTAFEKYESLHFPRSKQIVERSLSGGALGQWENPLAIRMRDTVLSLAPESLTVRLFDKFFGHDVTAVDLK